MILEPIKPDALVLLVHCSRCPHFGPLQQRGLYAPKECRQCNVGCRGVLAIQACAQAERRKRRRDILLGVKRKISALGKLASPAKPLLYFIGYASMLIFWPITLLVAYIILSPKKKA